MPSKQLDSAGGGRAPPPPPPPLSSHGTYFAELRVVIVFFTHQVLDDEEARLYQAHDSGIYLYRESIDDATDDVDGDSCWKALCFVHLGEILPHNYRIKYVGENHASNMTSYCS